MNIVNIKKVTFFSSCTRSSILQFAISFSCAIKKKILQIAVKTSFYATEKYLFVTVAIGKTTFYWTGLADSFSKND